MKQPTKRYGILDDFGEVIRWQWDKPSDNYKFIIEKIKKQPTQKESAVDWNNFEPAPF